MQVGNGLAGLIRAVGKDGTLVSGTNLAYRDGEINYYAGSPFRSWRSLGNAARPFFVLGNSEPVDSIMEILGCDRDPAPRISISRHQCTVVVMANRNGIPAVMHYASCDDSIAELRRTADGLRMASADPWIKAFCARLLDDRALPNGAAMLAQTRIPADPYVFSWNLIDTANEFWSGYARTDGNRVLDAMKERLELACGCFSQYYDMLAPVANALMEWCDTTQVGAGFVHGDFWLGNVLFKDDRVAAIIDWEWARRDGIPAADLLHMLLRSPSMAQDTSFAETLRRFWKDELDETELSRRLKQLTLKSGFGFEDLKFIGLVLWFDILWQRALRGVVESQMWLEDMIPQTAPVALQWIKRSPKARVL